MIPKVPHTPLVIALLLIGSPSIDGSSPGSQLRASDLHNSVFVDLLHDSGYCVALGQTDDEELSAVIHDY
jgi:hypothetical protein